jgi:hypothetical protein
MTIGDQHPIDPLPEPAWDRIRRNVLEELDSAAAHGEPLRLPQPRRRAAIAMALTAAASAALALAGAWLLRPAPVERPGLSSTRIATGASGIEANLGDVPIHVERRSALVAVQDARASWLVVLERGAAVFSVPPRAGRPEFVVDSGNVRVEVVGTRFRVERVGASARVDTYEGTVRVVAGGRAVLLGKGQRWPQPSAPHAAPANVPVPAVQESPASPEGSALPAERHSPPAGQDAARRAFERAASLEASAPDAALRIYQRLEQEGSPWAANALYARARLQLERGDRAAAAGALRRYLDRFPHGPNAADARTLLARLTTASTRETAP